MTRVTRRMLIGSVALAGLVALFLVEERVRGSLALRAWQRAMRDRGEKVTIEELTPPFPTNPAVRVVSPLEAQGLLAASAPPPMPGGMQMVAPGKARLVSAATWWVGADGKTNSWGEIAEPCESLRLQLAELRPLLTNHALFIRLDFNEGYELMLPHLAKAKAAMQALNAGTLHALHEGRLDEAYDNLFAATDLLDLLKDERLLISQLVRLADAAIAQAGLWEALQSEGWTEGRLAALQARWEQQDFMAGMGRGLEGERAMAALAYDPKRYSLRKLLEVTTELQSLGFGVVDAANATPSELTELFAPLIAAGRGVRRVIHLVCWRFAWADQDQLFHHLQVQQQIEAARRAAKERRWETKQPSPPDEVWEVFHGPDGRDRLNGYDRLRYWLALTTLPAWRSALGKAARMEVVREQVVAAIALKRYQLRHGQLPSKLEDLVPEFVATVPRDWYAAAPLRYRPQETGGYALYSVGEDGVDDGGDSRDIHGEVRGLHLGRDLVWPQAASPEEIAAAELKRVKKARGNR